MPCIGDIDGLKRVETSGGANARTVKRQAQVAPGLSLGVIIAAVLPRAAAGHVQPGYGRMHLTRSQGAFEHQVHGPPVSESGSFGNSPMASRLQRQT